MSYISEINILYIDIIIIPAITFDKSVDCKCNLKI